MPTQPKLKPLQEFTAVLGPMNGGVNSDVSPLLLPPTVMASSLNTTVRGTFVTQRSVFRQRTIADSDLALVNSAFVSGPFQGGTYCRPDFGAEFLIIVIGGRIFTITPQGLDLGVEVKEVTIPGDPITRDAPQVWLWQAENWVIMQDGILNPVIYGIASGTSTRSNFQQPVNFSTTVGSAFVAPATNTAYIGVNLASTANMSVGDVVSISGLGAMVVQLVSDATHVDLLNLTVQSGVTVSVGKVVSWSHQGTELPPGRMGTYGMGRIWMSLPDQRSFLAGDIVGGSSGTAAHNFRDAVLNITENFYLAGGGSFVVPGSAGVITAMRFSSTLDASLGQGPLQVFTHSTVFSCQTPVDRLTWQDVTNPILTEALIGGGAEGQNSSINVNGDIWFRSVDGLRSLVLGRRDFATPGNVPQSREVQPLLDLDDQALLDRGSAIVFDNRLLMTASPTQLPQGVIFRSLIPLNLDPISTLRGKTEPVYDAVQWTGYNVLQLFVGQFTGTERAFFFSYNNITNSIEMCQILPSSSTAYLDNDVVRIAWDFNTASLFRENAHVFKRLLDGEIYVDQVTGHFDYQAWYKPDQHPCWIPWFAGTQCQTQPNGNGNGIVPGFVPRLGLGEPPPIGDPNTGRMFRNGYTFDIRFIFMGKARFLGARLLAIAEPEPHFALPDRLGKCPE